MVSTCLKNECLEVYFYEKEDYRVNIAIQKNDTVLWRLNSVLVTFWSQDFSEGTGLVQSFCFHTKDEEFNTRMNMNKGQNDVLIPKKDNISCIMFSISLFLFMC